MRPLIVALALALCGSAAAQSPELSREFQAGVDAFRLGKLDQARAHLERALSLDPKLAGPHRFLAAVAQAQGRWPDCIDAARRALALNPRSTELADTRRLHEDCRHSAGRPAFRGSLGDGAAIAVTTNVPGAAVRIGGLTYGGTPLAPRPIAPGTLTIELAKSGWRPARIEVDALPGVVTDVSVELDADPLEPTGWLVVTTPADHIAIDGAPRPLAPDGRYELAPGPHVVELRRTGRTPWQRRIQIVAGQRTPISPSFDPPASRSRTKLYLIGAAVALGGLGVAVFLVTRNGGTDAAAGDDVLPGVAVFRW